MYNATVLNHFQNPHNTGDIADADGVGSVGNPACGDVIKVYIKVENNLLVDIKYKTFACAAAIASVDRIFSAGLLDELPEKVALMGRSLDSLAGHPNVGDVRRCGMMVGIELVRSRKGSEAFDPALSVGAKVCRHALAHDIIIRPLGDVAVLMPAPAMDTATLNRLFDGVVAAIGEYFRGHE